MMRSAVFAVLIAFLVPVCSAAQSPAGQAAEKDTGVPPAVFHSESRLVVLDVVAYDRHGAPIRGLKSSDFVVRENGAAQKIVQFEPHAAASAATAQLPYLPAGAVTNYAGAAANDALVVILLDNLNTEFLYQKVARTEIAKYLKALKPGTRLALYSMGTRLALLQGFTQNAADILSAMNGLQGLPKETPLNRTLSVAAPVRLPKGTTAKSRKAFLDSTVSLDYSPERALRRTYWTDLFLRELIGNLAPLHGRKSILWFSGQFPFTVDPNVVIDGIDDTGAIAEELKVLTDMLIDGQISIYPIDPLGLPGTDSKGVEQLSTSKIAEDTGGRAFYNTNSLADAISVAVDEAQNYYTIAYVPSDRNWDGKFRNIKVEVPGVDGSVSYHHGYYARADGTSSLVQKTTSFFAKSDSTSFLHGAPDQTGIIFSATIDPLEQIPNPQPRQKDGRNLKSEPWERYKLHFNVNPEQLTFDITPDGTRIAKLQVGAVVFTPGGKGVSTKNGLLTIKLTADEYEKARGTALSFSQIVEGPSSGAWIRLVLHDLSSLRTGSLETATLADSKH